MCGAKRIPFTARTVNLAGQPAKVGGIAARVFGWVTLVFGSTVALGLMLILQAIWPAGWLGYAVAIPIALLTLAVSLTAIIGGKALGNYGKRSELSAQHETIRALAQHRNGWVTASEVARALGVSEERADDMLTDLAKQGGDVSLDLTDDGRIVYLFGLGREALGNARWRIAEERAAENERIAREAEAEAEAHEAEASARLRKTR